MRLVGTLDQEPRARRFADYLQSKEIQAEVRPMSGTFGVWVHQEDQVPASRLELEAFLQTPDDARFTAPARVAPLRPRPVVPHPLHRGPRAIARRWVRQIWPSGSPVTALLIGACLVVALISSVGTNMRQLEPFFFAPPKLELVKYNLSDGTTEVRPVLGSAGLEPIKHGQVWRVFTPMFIHYGWPHLIFNMMALYWFGGLIEARKGSWVLLGLVLAAAAFSNLCQYLWDVENSGPNGISLPGGMSGVIYALFGYVWMTGEYEPESGFQLTSNTIIWMLMWLVLCLTGSLGPIANAAHVSGLVFGMLLALAPYLIGYRNANGTDSG